MDRRSLGMKNEVWINERESARNLYFARADQQVDVLSLVCCIVCQRSSGHHSCKSAPPTSWVNLKLELDG